MRRKIIESSARVASIISELIAHRGLEAPMIATKAAVGRLVYKVDLERFFLMRLHDEPMSRWPDYLSYFGELEPGLRTLNWDGEGKHLTVDKLCTAERLVSHGIPTIPILACVGRDPAARASAQPFPALNSTESLRAFLGDFTEDIFVKPAAGWRGEGIFKLERRSDGWAIDHTRVDHTAAAEFLLEHAPPSGLLLQPALRSHPDLEPVGGNFGLSTIRINTALTGSGPEILFVFAKLLGAPSLTDNFTEGRSGNLIAQVDVETGELQRVFGRKPGQKHLLEAFEFHPATKQRLVGYRLPLWRETVDLALQAAAAFPEAPLIGADVAITDGGPLIVEIQSDWGSNGGQLVRGGLRPVLRDLLPRLAANDSLKAAAMREMGLNGTHQRKAAARQPRT